MVVSIGIFDRQRKKAGGVKKEYERRQYFLVLSTMEGKGENTLEKFMDLVTRIFPHVRNKAKDYPSRKNWWLDETKRAGEIKYDIVFSNRIGFSKTWFLVKKFDKTVTFDDITNVWMKDDGEKKRENLRIVVIAKDYDPEFFTDEFDDKMKDLIFNQTREEETKTIRDLKKKKGEYEKERDERLKGVDRDGMDLLIEKEYGFTPLWLH